MEEHQESSQPQVAQAPQEQIKKKGAVPRVRRIHNYRHSAGNGNPHLSCAGV